MDDFDKLQDSINKLKYITEPPIDAHYLTFETRLIAIIHNATSLRYDRCPDGDHYDKKFEELIRELMRLHLDYLKMNSGT